MNVHDTRRIEEILQRGGHEPVKDAKEAEIAIVNSCTIREKPWHKAISETGRLRKGKNQKSKKVIVGLVGCVAQQEGENIFHLLSDVDFVVSPDNYAKLPEIIDELHSNSQHLSVTGFSEGKSEDFLTVDSVHENEVSAFVTIMKGCQERCKYCIVPTVRGPERHRPVKDILAEVTHLVENGVKEVTLLGQKVNAYNYEGVSFAALLEKIDAIDGVERLRFTSPHPKHMTEEVTSCFGTLKSLCESIHLPVQAGSNRTLKAMGRRYTCEGYLDVVKRLRQACPSIAISTDLIVGYPGETEVNFKETLSLIEEVGFVSAFSFKFSPRPSTPAFKLEDNVTEQEKSDRLARVHDVINKLEVANRNSIRGKVVEVLVSSEGRLENQLSGRTRDFQIVNFISEQPLSEAVGKCILVKVIEVHPNSLEGELV